MIYAVKESRKKGNTKVYFENYLQKPGNLIKDKVVA